MNESLAKLVGKWRKHEKTASTTEIGIALGRYNCADELESALAEQPRLTEEQVPWRQYFILRMRGDKRTAGEDVIYAQLEKQLRKAALLALPAPEVEFGTPEEVWHNAALKVPAEPAPATPASGDVDLGKKWQESAERLVSSPFGPLRNEERACGLEDCADELTAWLEREQKEGGK